VPFPPFDPAEPILTVSGVSKSYGDQQVLADISFALRAGERLALTGPSGGGKTTLLNCIGGVDHPDQGSIRLHQTELTTLSSDGLAQVRRRQIGTIFQFFHLLPTLSAFENIELPLQLLGVGGPERAARVDALVRRVGLGPRAGALPAQLSGGEQQRVAIARALVHRPSLVLADEPTGNLDSAHGATVLALLRELTDESGAALVLVTHSEEAATICHRRLAVRDGRIVSGS
jgi:putative ABC transport system ATP-binding protein